jgi:SAM-dependent methyltransferase
VVWGTFDRRTPVSRVWGFDRGRPVDRHYIETFLGHHRLDIRGTVLEVADPAYTRQFGDDRVSKSEVLHVDSSNPRATLVGDLVTGSGLPTEAFDAIILTQTLQFVYDVRTAVATLHRLLRPGGVVLVTVPGISQICREEMEQWGDFWRFTSRSAGRLFSDTFGPANVMTRTYGNVRAAAAFLYGLAAEEVGTDELDYHDPDYEVIVGVRAVKANGA